jgi:hypothetical protein
MCGADVECVAKTMAFSAGTPATFVSAVLITEMGPSPIDGVSTTAIAKRLAPSSRIRTRTEA